MRPDRRFSPGLAVAVSCNILLPHLLLPLTQARTVDTLQRYRRKHDTLVAAVQLRLETPGFTYQKWGGVQTCKAGDWLVDNAGEVYTVDQEVFARTYRPAAPGLYRKVTAIWAVRTTSPGTIDTKEGVAHYEAGEYLVYNDPERLDGYVIQATKFGELYELDEPA